MSQVQIVDSAWVTRQVLDSKTGTVSGAVYDREGMLLQASQRNIDREEGYELADPTSLQFGERVVGQHQLQGADLALDRAQFCGHTFGGWGHSLTEGLGSLWPDPAELRNIPLIFQPWGRSWESAIGRFAELVRLAGYDSNPLVVTSGLCVVQELLLPQRLMNLDKVIHEGAPIDPRMNDVYGRVIANASAVYPLVAAGPVFLSRGAEHRRQEPYELELEESFRKAGFLIFRGWEHSVAEQVARISHSSALVGMSGSALHNSVFAPPGIPVLEILDTRERQFQRRRHSMQKALCDLRGQCYESFDPAEAFPESDFGMLFHRVIEVLRVQ